MKIAMTGATGFLGRYIVRHLVGAGHRLRCWHRPNADRSGFEDVAGSVEWLPGELGDPVSARELVGGATLSCTRPFSGKALGIAGPAAMALADAFFGINLTGTLQLFQVAFEASVSRFVFISTCAVHDVILDNRPLDETHPLWPTSHYGAHKAALEAFVHSYGLDTGWPICALRPTGIYGLAHLLKQSRWYDLVGQVLRGERIESPRGGKEVHAADVAQAVELLLRVDVQYIAGQSFNCYDLYVAEEQVARLAKELTGSASIISDLNRGPKHRIDTSKIRKLGMSFGGKDLLSRTVAQLVEGHQ